MKLFRTMRRNGAMRDRPAAASVNRFGSAARSHAGALRELNEDRYIDLPEVGLWAVADGMGGHAAGDMAAQMTVDALAALVDGVLSPAPAAIHEAIGAVNARLAQRTASGGFEATSGSTLVALLAAKGRYTCLWAGDSRAYVVREGRLVPISRDHSLVQEMVDAGILSPAEARDHPRSNVITRAVGVVGSLELEAATGSIGSEDCFLLCSDGLTAALEEREIESLLGGDDVEAAADALLGAALANHPRDNVTFVLVRPNA
jgi:serine/threonine-protein phosphatase Stp1